MSETKAIIRIKIMLDDKQRSNMWLVGQLGKDPTTVSCWRINTSQPTLDTLLKILGLVGSRLYRIHEGGICN